MVKSYADIEKISLLATTAPGSIAIVTGTSEKYILNNDYKWRLVGADQEGGDDEEPVEEVVYEGGDINTEVATADIDYEGGEVQ